MGSLVICMAGLNTRFHDVGFDIPKYLLPWKGNTIIHGILQELMQDAKFDEVLLLANKRDMYFKDHLVESISSLDLDITNIRYIGDTNGQAHTAYIAAASVRNTSKPLFIHNADTLILGRNFEMISAALETADAFVDVFVANNPKYSYVKQENGRVVEIVEKNPISPFASSGLYCFRSAELYQKYYNDLQNQLTGKEVYIADILSLMLKDGATIVTNDLNNDYETIVLGSPQEYGIEIAKQALHK